MSMTDSIRVTGGEPLTGEIRVRGAKNFVSKAMVAALLGSTPSTLRNVPEIRDVKVVSALLATPRRRGRLRRRVGRPRDGHQPPHVGRRRATSPSTRAPRASRSCCAARCCTGSARRSSPTSAVAASATGPSTSTSTSSPSSARRRLGEARRPVPQPPRTASGASSTSWRSPRWAPPSSCSSPPCMAEGVTTPQNAAVEPEIKDLIDLLQKMGAIISVDTDRSMTIEGVKTHARLRPPLAHRPHRGGLVGRRRARDRRATSLSTARSSAAWACSSTCSARSAASSRWCSDGIRFYHPGRELNSIALQTDVHPGFMTDWQQPLVVALTQAKGLSIVHETVYENRFGFTDALVKMGANVQLYRECLGDKKCRFGQRNFKHSRRHQRADAVARRRHRGPRPARRLLAPHRRARGGGHVERARHRHHRPRLRGLPRQARRARRDRRGFEAMAQSHSLCALRTRASRAVRPFAALACVTRKDWHGQDDMPADGRVHRGVEPRDATRIR